ncbi:hypothetical protein ACJJIF_13800 [Microbulbifer sp. SSSA002]|uniref:hypothetical protein n=1 Tax=Microbulbifer sp. SSSA002 TaxID=3243376 RepID=UPI00403A2DB9
MIPEFSSRAALAAWPFWVLELTPTASLNEVNRAARDLTGKLALKMAGADECLTPNGIIPRDEFLVREAQAVLITPERRLLAEFWYIPPSTDEQETSKPATGASQWCAYFGVG